VSQTVTLQELRDGAFDLADELNSGVIPVQSANWYINHAYRKLYDVLIKSGEDYNLLTQIITTNSPSDPAATSDVSVYKLPGGFYKTLGFDANLGGNQYVTLHRFNWNDRNVYKLWGTTGWFIGQPLNYRIQGNCVQFMPIPQGPFQVTQWYYPVAPKLSQDSQAVDVLSGGDLFIVAYAAGLMCQRQESFESADRLMAMADKELDRIRDMASDRDAAEPPRVTETIRRAHGFRRNWGV
jgi:hypothetical protein